MRKLDLEECGEVVILIETSGLDQMSAFGVLEVGRLHIHMHELGMVSSLSLPCTKYVLSVLLPWHGSRRPGSIPIWMFKISLF